MHTCTHGYEAQTFFLTNQCCPTQLQLSHCNPLNIFWSLMPYVFSNKLHVVFDSALLLMCTSMLYVHVYTSSTGPWFGLWVSILWAHHHPSSSYYWRSVLPSLHYVYMYTSVSIGFLYTGDLLHEFLHLTQYIAPLQADFNPNITDNGTVLVLSTGKGEMYTHVYILNSPFSIYM